MKRRKMNCFYAHSLSNLLTLAGFGAAMVGCILGKSELGGPLALILAIGGIFVMGCGFAVGYGHIVCPHCGQPLYDFPRLPSKIPNYCPHCGNYIEEPNS